MSRYTSIKKQSCCLTIDEDLVSGIDSIRGRIPRSTYVNSILEKHLEAKMGRH